MHSYRKSLAIWHCSLWLSNWLWTLIPHLRKSWIISSSPSPLPYICWACCASQSSSLAEARVSTMSSLFLGMFWWHFVKPCVFAGLGAGKEEQKSTALSQACNLLLSLQKTVSDPVSKKYSLFTLFETACLPTGTPYFPLHFGFQARELGRQFGCCLHKAFFKMYFPGCKGSFLCQLDWVLNIAFIY